MSSHERNRLQCVFEEINGVSNPIDLHGKGVFGTGLKKLVDVTRLRSFVLEEISDLYFKTIISFISGVNNLDRNYYSWATVEFYYSIFYAQKIRLLLKDIFFIRTIKNDSSSLFSLKLEKDNIPLKMKSPNNTDHKAVFHVWEEIESNIVTVADDGEYGILNVPGGGHLNIFEWYQKQREIVNYRSSTFLEDNIDEYWRSFKESSETLLTKLFYYISDESNKLQISTNEFDKDMAIFSIPCFILYKTIYEINKYKENRNLGAGLMSKPQKEFITEKINILRCEGDNVEGLLNYITL